VVRFRGPHGRWTERVAGSCKRAAELLKYRIECELAEGTFDEDPEKNPYFVDFSVRFLKAKKELVKPSTYEDYKRVIRVHLNPYFHEMKLAQITPLRVQEFLFHLNEKGLSPASRGKILRYLKNMLRTAVNWEMIDRDPSFAIRPPRQERREMDYLTPEEIQKLLRTAKGDMKALLAVACLAGLRQGEVLGLRWGDVDFDNHQLRVVRTYNPIHGFGAPKTTTSRRAVPIIPMLEEILEQHRASRRQLSADDLVFRNGNGNPKDRTNLTNREFKRVLEKAGLREIRFHDLRHSYASLAIASGMDPKALQRAMGHGSIRITLDVYAHLLPCSYDGAVERMEALLGTG
jgi:integrase